MKVRVIALIAAALFTVVSSSAEARHHHRHYRQHEVRTTTPPGEWGVSERIVSHPVGCPRSAFCGCGVSVRLYGHPVRALYPAAAYGKFPSCAASSGAVAYRAHHVFYIESANGDGTVQAYDPNSGGHLTRIHNVSLRGYRVVCPGGGHYAGL